jgi:Zn-dependent protease with chaperone function
VVAWYSRAILIKKFMGRLYTSSLITLGLLAAFVFGIVMAVNVYVGSINVVVAIIITIIINVIMWLVGPSFSDWVNRLFYKVTFLSQEEFTSLHPEVAAIIDQVSKEYSFPFPKIGIIADRNPTAFTYGSARYNARIIITEGIFHFLSPQEVRAVVAHELGHIVNRDFIVMMIAGTLVQILYEIYATLIRSKGKNSGPSKIIALASFVLYQIGIYLLYYLSRTREYLADQFSASITDPQDLSNALIKIAYGIVTVEDTESTQRLLQSTRHLGILDVKNAKHYGITSFITHSDHNALAEVMVFDKVSPWAWLVELSSTHPLTGKRIDHLSDIAKETSRPFNFDIDAAISRLSIDRDKLYNNFYIGVLFYFLPLILGVIALFMYPWPFFLAGIGLGIIIQIFYQYPFGPSKETTVIEEMRNPYASPLRGEPISLSGEVIGKGMPGYILSEDVMFQDKTGIIFFDYNSLYGSLGDIFFSLTKVKKLIGVQAKATGWFFRSMGSMVSLKTIETSDMKVKSHPIFWKIACSLVLLVISYAIYYYLYLMP